MDLRRNLNIDIIATKLNITGNSKLNKNIFNLNKQFIYLNSIHPVQTLNSKIITPVFSQSLNVKYVIFLTNFGYFSNLIFNVNGRTKSGGLVR